MIPFNTTTIDITRPEGVATDGLDPYDPYDPTVPTQVPIQSGVRAVIGTPSANVMLSGGDRVEYSATMRCDPCDLQSLDLVLDSDGTLWTVLWARQVHSFGIDVVEAELRMVQGAGQ